MGQRLAVEQVVLVLLKHPPPWQASGCWFCSFPDSFGLTVSHSELPALIAIKCSKTLVNFSRLFPPLNVSYFHLMIPKYLRTDISVSLISASHSAGVFDSHLTVDESHFQSGLLCACICHCVYLSVSLL